MFEKGFSYYREIIPPSRFFNFNLKEIFLYKNVLWVLVKRTILIRYRDTIFGSAYALFLPVFSMILFTFVFSYTMKVDTGGIPYPIFSYSGLILWTYFSAAISGSIGSILGNVGMLTKVYFPRVFFPLTTSITPLMDYVISLVVLVGLMFYYQYYPGIIILMLPLVLFFTFLLAVGIGFFFSAITVKYKDVQVFVPALLQFLMFVSPVLYPVTVFPKSIDWVLQLNPMNSFLNIQRYCILGEGSFDINSFIFSGAMSVVIFILGFVYFKKKEYSFADVF